MCRQLGKQALYSVHASAYGADLVLEKWGNGDDATV